MSNFRFNSKKIISSGLILKDHESEAEAIIGQQVDPVAALVSRECVVKSDFYPRLAKLYSLPYVSELQPPVSPRLAEAYQVPTASLVRSGLYPYFDGDTLL